MPHLPTLSRREVLNQRPFQRKISAADDTRRLFQECATCSPGALNYSLSFQFDALTVVFPENYGKVTYQGEHSLQYLR